MWVYDLETLRFLSVNDAAVEHYGYSRDEFLSMTIREIRPPEDVPALMARLQGYQPDLHTWTGSRHRRRDGTLIDVEVSSHSVDWTGRPARLALVNDVTQRKRADEKIQQQLDRLAALQEIDQIITSVLDLQLSLSFLLSHALRLLNVDAATVLLLNDVMNTLEYAAGLGFQTSAIKSASIRIGQSYAGRAVLERRMMQIPNLADEPDNLLLQALLKDENFVSYHGVPLIVKGVVIGVLEVFHRSFVERDQEWEDFLATLAGQAALAIDNLSLFNGLQRSNNELMLAYETTLEGWSHALDLRDKETEGHTRRVTDMTVQLARASGMSEAQLVNVRRGSLLHDIGKMGVPDNILLKPGPLTEDEWAQMRMHPVYAHDLLSPIAYLHGALDIPYCHHERWDGTGYPRGLRGEQIPLPARIFAVVDVWDALTSDRPYRKAWTKERALQFIQSGSGSSFDPMAVDLFLNEMSKKRES
jgi:PAS domain S-box-containing protein